jgi:hypothetical protein
MSKITFFPIQGSGGGGGSVDSVGATAPITSSGGSNPIISTSMNTNKLIGRSSSGVGVMEEITVGDGLELVSNVLTNTATPTPSGYYGAWQDNQTQSANANNVGVEMIFRQEDLSNGVSVVSNGTNLTRITFAHTGIYNLQFSSQFQNIDNAQHDVSIWLRRNGVDIDGSAGFVDVPVRKNVSEYGHVVVSWNYLLDVVGGQYYELMWSTTDYQNITMQYYPATNPPPAVASVILTVTQQSGIMAGSGITALNGLTADVQTFATGTSGTDFNISSSGSTHTFNIPTASNLARGLVSILAQTFAGIKTFLSAPILDSLTASRILATNGSKAVQSLDTATYPDLTELSYVKGVTSAIQTQLNSKQGTLPYTPVYVYAKSSSTFSSSGTGTQVLTSVLIPANTFTSGDTIRITARFKKVGTAGTTQTNMLLNTLASISGATIFKANIFVAGTLASGMQSQGVIINNTTNTQLAWIPTNLGTTDLVNSTSAWQENVAINWTINQYLIFSCNPNGVGDVVSLIYYQIEKL